MRRTLVLAVLCLAFSVVVNYGVAWWLVLTWDPIKPRGPVNFNSLNHASWTQNVPANWPDRASSRLTYSSSHHLFTSESAERRIDPEGGEFHSYRTNTIESGWPKKSIRSVSHRYHNGRDGSGRQTPAFSFGAGIGHPDSSVNVPFVGTTHARRLPLTPIWPGFAFNILLFAFIPALIVLPWRPLNRMRRRRRGACLACGYDLSATLESPCPECGSEPVSAGA